MRLGTISRLRVTLDLDGEALRVGDLAWAADRRVAAFEFAPLFLDRGLNLSPFHLPLGGGIKLAPPLPFGGLHGLFADSLPDGWGRLLVDRRVAAAGGDPASLTPLDRLAIVGATGMGALCYQPEAMTSKDGAGSALAAAEFDRLASAAADIQDGISTAFVDELQKANGGSAGARPKVLVRRDPRNGRVSLDSGPIMAAAAESWLVKFPSKADTPDIGRVEHAYALMARDAGIDFPETALFDGASGAAYFGVRRFDRRDGKRLHIHTMAGLLHADFRIPSLDYRDFMELTRRLTNDARQVEEAFSRMVFNIVAGNRDDHAKNHAYIMGSDGAWRLTPAYDVTPSDGPGGEHNLTIAGEGRAPVFKHVAAVATGASISKTRMLDIVERVAHAAKNWPLHAQAAGLGQATEARIAALLARNLSGMAIASPDNKPPGNRTRPPKKRGSTSVVE